MEVRALRDLWHRCLDEVQEDWQSWKIQTRPVDQDDWELLFNLYAETRRDILSLAIEPVQKNFLIQQQFELQQHHYRENFSNAIFQVIEIDEQPIGRWYYHATDQEHRVVDVIVAPQYRRRGIGTTLMRAAMLCSAIDRLPLRLRAGFDSPARHWYLKMGFTILEYEPAHWHLQFMPEFQKDLAANNESHYQRET